MLLMKCLLIVCFTVLHCTACIECKTHCFVQYGNTSEGSLNYSNMNVSTTVGQAPPTFGISVESQLSGGAIGGATVRSSSRDRNYTDKGLSWQINQKQQQFHNAISGWRRKAGRVERLLSDSVETKDLKKERDALQCEMNTVESVYKQLDELLSHADKKGTKYDRYESIETENHGILKRISQCIRELNGSDSHSRSSTRSHISKHSKRSRSSQLSHSSKKADAAAEAAVLKAEMKYIDSELEKKADLKKLLIQKRLDMAEAKVEAITNIERENTPFDLDKISDGSQEYVKEYVQSQIISEAPLDQILPQIQVINAPTTTDTADTLVHAPSTHVPIDLPKTRVPLHSIASHTSLNPSVEEFKPRANFASQQTSKPLDTVSTWMYPNSIPASVPISTTPNQKINSFLNFAQSFAEQINLNRLPLPEPSVFVGDLLQYPGWKCTFEALIDNRGVPYTERIHYLKKYLGGPAKEAIEGYFLLSTTEAYEEAKTLLEQRYGDPFVVTNAFREKLDNWPKIPPRDGFALRKFSDFLRQCETAMSITGGLRILNDDRENRKMLSKLPDWLVSRWGRKVSDWKEADRGFPPFSEFRNFIVKEANIACDPVTSLQSLRELTKPETNPLRPKRIENANSLLTEVNEDSTKGSRALEVSKCAFCDKIHNIDVCRLFQTKPMEEQKSFAKENDLCYACLKKGHRSRFCQNRISCKKCGRSHPTPFHGDVWIKGPSKPEEPPKPDQSIQTATSHFIESNSASKSSLVLPVWVSHQDDPDREVLTYALLDTQSDTTFVLNKTCESLGVTGTESKLLLSTMSVKNQLIDTKHVNGLLVRGYDSSLKIPISTAFTRNMIPANRTHIPSPQMAEQWPHLRQIADKIKPILDCDVGLLIGYNCPRALVPGEVIPPVNNEPYGQRTDLGWGIVGNVDPTLMTMTR